MEMNPLIKDVAVIGMGTNRSGKPRHYIVVIRYVAGDQCVLRRYEDTEKQASVDLGQSLAEMLSLSFTLDID